MSDDGDDGNGDDTGFPPGLTGGIPPRIGKERRLEKGWIATRLIHDLARMDQTEGELAAKYEVLRTTISAFKIRHLEQIAAVAQDIENEFAGLWIADKKSRLAELQQDVDDINQQMDNGLTPMQLAVLMNSKRAAMKQAAEELGQLLNRSHVTLAGDVRVRYLTDNVNDEDLV